jgi:hypothetical protein
MFLLISSLLAGSAVAQQPDISPDFGADVSGGYAYGGVSGDGLGARTHGAALFRLDSFVQDRTHKGPRLGMGVWGQMTVGPEPTLKTIGELGAEVEEAVSFNHVGISAVLRHDTELPVSGTFGVGFGRLEMKADGPDPVGMPAFTIEGGARTKLRDHVFLDLMARAHWATRVDPMTGRQIEWWFIELAALIGSHVR